MQFEEQIVELCVVRAIDLYRALLFVVKEADVAAVAAEDRAEKWGARFPAAGRRQVCG